MPTPDAPGIDHQCTMIPIQPNTGVVAQTPEGYFCPWCEIARLRKLLTDAEDPVSCQLAEARRNLELYKGYSSRERRYQYEIDQLERLQTQISASTR